MKTQLLLKRLSKIPIFVWFLIFGFAIFGSILFNDFIIDDFGQIVDNPYVHSLKYIFTYFNSSTFYIAGLPKLFGIYYKPLLPLSYSLMYAIAGPNPAFFHFIQILLHILNAYLVYRFLKNFFPSISSILALIFLVHPINTEVVAYIADLQDILFVTFGLTAINLVIISKTYNFSRWILIYGFLLFSLFSKETGVLFLAILLSYFYIFNRKYFNQAIFTSTAVLTSYGFFRFLIAGVGLGSDDFTPISNSTLLTRLINIPQIITYYFKTLIFPKNLYMYNQNIITLPTFDDFYLPLVIVFITLFLILYFGKILYFDDKQKFKVCSFFFFWVLVGIGFHSNFFPLDALVADRWFYFPFIGLLGSLGVFFDRFNPKGSIYSLGLMLILLLLSSRTFDRSKDFKDTYTLASHDILFNPESSELESILGGALLDRGEYAESIVHLENSASIFPNSGLTWYKLGVARQKYVISQGNANFNDAIAAYKKSIEISDNYNSYNRLSDLYLHTNKFEDAILVAEAGLKHYTISTELLLTLSVSNYKLGNNNLAQIFAQRLVKLDPSLPNLQVLDSIEKEKPINIAPFKF